MITNGNFKSDGIILQACRALPTPTIQIPVFPQEFRARVKNTWYTCFCLHHVIQKFGPYYSASRDWVSACKMASKRPGRPPFSPSEQRRRKLDRDRQRRLSEVYLGDAKERWDATRLDGCFSTDRELAVFLLDL